MYFFLFLYALFMPLGATEKPLNVGMELSYPPFEMVDTQGNPTGISVEMAYALGNYLDREVKIHNLPYTALIPALKSGKVDVVISSLTITEKRKQAIDFSKPYLATGLSLLVQKGSPIQTTEDLNQAGKTVVVKLGTSSHVFANEHLKGARVIVLDKENTAVMEVIQGKADAFIYDQLSIYNHWKKHPEQTEARLTPFKKEYWAIGIKKGNDKLRKQVNAFLIDFRKNKGFDTLSNTYLKDAKQTFDKEGIPFIFSVDD